MVSAAGWASRLLEGWAAAGEIEADDGSADPVRDWAESGVVWLTGRADGPPLVPPGFGATAARGAESAFRALVASLPSSPRVTEVPVGWHRLLGERAALSGATRRAPWSVGATCRAVATADGWVALNLARIDDVASVPALVGTGWGESASAGLGAEDAWRVVEVWAGQRSCAEVVARAVLLGLPCGAVPASDGVRAPSDPFVRVEIAAGSPPPDEVRPLVVDLSALWAGPLCAHLLGSVGARVVKVETVDRLDGARRGDPCFYDLLHAGHDSVVVDPSRAADRHLLDRLLDLADIVVSAARPRAWVSLGIDPYDVCRRSETTWAAITAYGLGEGERVGFGDDVAMAGGAVARLPGSGPPYPAGDALADPLTGMHAAVAALASYRKGGSRLLDVSMRHVVAATSSGSATETIVARARDDGWTVDGARGSVRVLAPSSRPATTAAASAGRDTERWRCR